MAFYEREIDVIIDEAALQAKVRELGAQITATIRAGNSHWSAC